MAEKPVRIAVVGSLNVDSVVRVSRFPRPGETVIGKNHNLYPGGKGGNQAFAAARLSQGDANIEVLMLGQVGGDGHGAWLRQNLLAAGVDVACVGTDESVSSGIAVITIDDTAQNHIIIAPGANGTFTPAVVGAYETTLRTAQVVLLQLEIPLETVELCAQSAHEAGAQVILDPAPARLLSPRLLSLCDYITPNENELRVLLGHPSRDTPLSYDEAVSGARALNAQGARNVVVKMGAAGAVCASAEGVHRFAAFPVEAVDTTAAGDAWNGAFAVALARGYTLERAGQFACATAALSVSRAGAQPSMPSHAEVERLLASQ